MFRKRRSMNLVLPVLALAGCGVDGPPQPAGVPHEAARMEVPGDLVVSIAWVEDATLLFVQERSLAPELAPGDWAISRVMLRNDGRITGNRFNLPQDAQRAERAIRLLVTDADWCPERTAFHLDPDPILSDERGERVLRAYIGWKAGWAFIGRCLPTPSVETTHETSPAGDGLSSDEANPPAVREKAGQPARRSKADRTS